MEKNQSLFRQEAINNRLNRSLGSIRINAPLSYKLVSMFSIVLLTMLLLFLFIAEFTEKIVVKGYLDADKGIVTIDSEQGGTILKSDLEEGQRIKKGDTLFILSNEEKEHTKELMANLKQRINNLKQEYQLKQDHYQAMIKLYEKHYVPASLLKNIKAELLEIKNKIKALDLDGIKYKQSLYQCFKSPVSGIITNILYKPGQIVAQSKPLVQIIPQESKLIARLYVPAQEIGFFKKNKGFSIQYDAYPIQRFGIQRARIREINLTILTDGKEDKPIQVGQPYYKVKAELEKPYIRLYGKKTPLNYGMTLSAQIRGEKKKIWEWILDPIYSYYGDIF